MDDRNYDSTKSRKKIKPVRRTGASAQFLQNTYKKYAYSEDDHTCVCV